ncbi:ABC transporter permease subunit [Embleya sp. NBC_00896]|uniref:ABC transporter permease subunit n=1 Tax=Embleya sp. NBC_00896 TaxID=2975961 RepID=UPI002F911A49|nr:ABC transporter permease subunit [Embleya sp. NBC_00896]
MAGTVSTDGASATGPLFVSRAAGSGKVTFVRVLNAEWIKLRSLRSTFWVLVTAVFVVIALGLLITSGTVNRWPSMSADEKSRFSAPNASLTGLYLAQLAIGVLGVLVVTGEYATGSIRATMSAVPHRLPVLWAKTLVFGAVTFALMLGTCLIAFLSGQAVLAREHIGVSLGDPGVPRVVVGVAVYLAVTGVLAIGIGAIVRTAAGGIAIVFGLLLVLPEIARALPASWQDHISKYLPSEAGQALSRWHPEADALSPGMGITVFVLYAAVTLAVAAVLLRRRDA